MGHLRPRYNKARQEQLDARRQGRKKGHATEESAPDGLGSNADVLVPKTAAEKAKERELRKLQEENESKGKMSSKKKKRLDNYVEKKLKAERRGELFKELEASQKTISTPLLLQPSSTLGSKQFKTNQEKLDKSSSLVDRRREKVIQSVGKRKAGYHSDGEESDEAIDAEDADNGRPLTRELDASSHNDRAETQTGADSDEQGKNVAVGTSEAAAPKPQATSSTVATVGSGLKRGADGLAVIPVVVKRRRKTVQRRRFGEPKIKPHLRGLGLEASDSDASSFDSSDSEYDTHTDDDDDDDEGPADEAESKGEEGDNEEEEWTGFGGGSEQEEDGVETAKTVRFADDQTSADKAIGDDGQRIEEEDDDEEDGDEDEAEEDDDESESDDDSGDNEEAGSGKKRKSGGFKEWANQQLGIEVRSEEGAPLQPSQPAVKRQEGPLRGPLGEELVVPVNSLMSGPASTNGALDILPKKTKRPPVIIVERSEELQAKRLQLPILAEEDTIMEAIRLHSVVVLCGETGSGKTTQVPQFLYEAGFGTPGSDNSGMIGITQPRRVAAMSMATRVAEELSLPSSRVSYQIRYDATTSSSTSIKFMTDGVLLRELANDFLLNRYSVVIVDEAHERSVNTDVLIGTLSRVVKLREELWREGKDGIKPLRLIIMSATLRVTDFTENATLFKTPPPLINVAARQHPVTVHFNRKTRPDYLDEAYKKVSKIHARLPSGGILVFLTGQNEITTLCRRLEKRFGEKAISERMQRRQRLAMGSDSWRGATKTEDKDKEIEEDDAARSSRQADVEPEEVDLGNDQQDLAADVDDGVANHEIDPDDLDSDNEYEEDDPDGLFADREEDSDTPLHILPLYSLLPSDKQMRVFKDPPEGHRLVVVATNVAETSLTIPNIKYVVDSGRAKERRYDNASGIQSFEVSWISKASASQRTGRAGRTGPGHCYRLFSSAVFETHCAQHTSPEITRMPIEGIVLQMKSMNIDAVVNFPFPTPPDRAALQKAERILVNLGALTAPSSSAAGSGKNIQARITELGNAMSLFPLSPRFSKMLVVGQQHGCLPYVIALVSALSVGDPFLRAEALGFGTEYRDDQEVPDMDMIGDEGSEIRHIKNEEVKAKEIRKLQRRAYYQVMQRHSALGKFTSDIFKMLSVVGAYEFDGGSVSFCDKNYVRVKAMQEIHKLRHQVSRIVSANYPGLEADFNPKLLPPNDTQLKVLRQLVTAAFIDQVAVRKDLIFPGQAPDGSKFASTRGIAYRAVGVDEDVFIHPSSTLFHGPPPECVVYQELVRTSRLFIRVVTKINQAWLPSLGKPLCTFSRILETPATSKATKSTPTKDIQTGEDPDERECFVQPKFAEFDSLQLAPVKVTQKRIGSRWVFL